MTAIVATPASSLDLGVLAGDWRNTNADGSITRIVCRPIDGGRLSVQCFDTDDWGSVEAPVYAFTFDSKQAGAFNAVFDLRNEQVHLQANVKGGVLVVASFNRIKDHSGRSSYFAREFFHRVAMA
jgi:hypothetical protein